MAVTAALMIAAFILFVIAALPFATPKIEIISAGLACAALSAILA